MKKISKRSLIKIPKDISVLFCDKKKIITFFGPLGKKSLALKLKILLIKSKNSIIVTKSPCKILSNNERKKIEAIQGTTIALIKQTLLEISFNFFKKLIFVGVGFKAFQIDLFKTKILHFKLGYSHQIYFRIPTNLNIYCHKATTIFIFSSNYQKTCQAAALIRSYKIPEPYKGKGILYENEKITLKEGKKV